MHESGSGQQGFIIHGAGIRKAATAMADRAMIFFLNKSCQ
jgi:hypothetical protein